MFQSCCFTFCIISGKQLSIFRDLPTILTVDIFAILNDRTMHEVWQTVLEETDRVGKVRLLAADTYLLQISEPCKPVRSAKAQIAKKVTIIQH